MDKVYYLAYGSNLNLRHMKDRCPHARPIGTASLPDRRLVFRGAARGYYLTLEPAPGFAAPVGLWDVPATDLPALDYYEGYPEFYYKASLPSLDCLSLTGQAFQAPAFLYLMRESYAYGLPTEEYGQACAEGFQDFGFDPALLRQAYDYSKERLNTFPADS